MSHPYILQEKFLYSHTTTSENRDKPLADNILSTFFPHPLRKPKLVAIPFLCNERMKFKMKERLEGPPSGDEHHWLTCQADETTLIGWDLIDAMLREICRALWVAATIAELSGKGGQGVENRQITLLSPLRRYPPKDPRCIKGEAPTNHVRLGWEGLCLRGWLRASIFQKRLLGFLITSSTEKGKGSFHALTHQHKRTS